MGIREAILRDMREGGVEEGKRQQMRQYVTTLLEEGFELPLIAKLMKLEIPEVEALIEEIKREDASKPE